MTDTPQQITRSVEIQNIVTACGIGIDLDLEALSDDLSQAQFDPERFPGLMYRTVDPKVTTLVFRSGKIVSTGADSVTGSESGVKKLIDEFHHLGIECDTPTVEIQNIVGGADIGCDLNLNAIAIGLGLENTEYEPEQFPGLVYRMDDPSVVVLLFSSGKLVVTGAREHEQIDRGVEELHSRLDKYALLN